MTNANTFADDHWDEVGHYYTPIAYFDGKVLKYAGIATKGNAWFVREHPGTLVLDANKGDRILADNYTLFGR